METSDLIARLQQGRYGETPSEILALAKSAAEIDKQRQDPGLRSQWIQGLDIHPDTWSKVVGLGQAEALYSPEMVGRLPANFSTLALLARCSGEELQEALANGLINPRLTYRALAAWRRARSEEETKKAPLFHLVPIAIAMGQDTCAMDELAINTAIHEALAALNIKTQIIHLNGWEHIEEQTTEQWQAARLEEARQQVNKIINPHHISKEELSNLPLTTLKAAKSGATKSSLDVISALKYAELALNGISKQQRYSNKARLLEMAAKGSEFAKDLMKNVLGVSGTIVHRKADAS
ncbi:MAG: hypothetical protein KFB97_12620 [Cyanobium sp. M30B3]|nr:MAG: hypothetical protein KFB97_12620 [Cyanobium sp. M30B3]